MDSLLGIHACVVCRFDGLVLRLIGDGKAYSIVLKTRERPAVAVVDGEGGEGVSEAAAEEEYPVYEYAARMATRKGANNVSLRSSYGHCTLGRPSRV